MFLRIDFQEMLSTRERVNIFSASSTPAAPHLGARQAQADAGSPDVAGPGRQTTAPILCLGSLQGALLIPWSHRRLGGEVRAEPRSWDREQEPSLRPYSGTLRHYQWVSHTLYTLYDKVF